VSVSNPLLADDLGARVRTVLDAFLDHQQRTLYAVAPECTDMVHAVRDLLGGGKRLRPAFCYWGARGAGAPGDDELVRAAVGLELFQAAALIHDDVMDDSDLRRGMPAVHRRFAAQHQTRDRLGDCERYGMAGAVLTGDLCLAWSDELFSTSGLAPQALRRGRVMFDRMRTELMAGQFLDMLGQSDPHDLDADEAVERARHVIRYKSAKYTIEHPLMIGGLLAGADEHLLAAYSEFGLDAGEAFQLRDDLLGVFGNPSQTGKPAGDDLREGKRTVLIACARRGATSAEARTISRLLGAPGLDAGGVAELQAVIVRTEAHHEVEQMIVDRTKAAQQALAAARMPETARAVLSDLVTAATTRAQ
jgi:geranylgeranyl diphosphate synthase, type I